MSFDHLLSPGRIGTMSLRNRILMCPMGDDQATDGGYVTPQQIAYYEARARGGAALLLVGSVGISSPEGLASPQQSAIGDASFVDGWRRGRSLGFRGCGRVVRHGLLLATAHNLLAGAGMVVFYHEAYKMLGLTKPDLFVCRDTALDDTVAANLALQCTLKVL